MVRMSTVDSQFKRLEFKHSGNKNRMVKLCRGIAYIQAHSPVKGNRRHGERRVINPQFITFYAERQAELLKRAAAEVDAQNGQR